MKEELIVNYLLPLYSLDKIPREILYLIASYLKDVQKSIYIIKEREVKKNKYLIYRGQNPLMCKLNIFEDIGFFIGLCLMDKKCVEVDLNIDLKKVCCCFFEKEYIIKDKYNCFTVDVGMSYIIYDINVVRGILWYRLRTHGSFKIYRGNKSFIWDKQEKCYLSVDMILEKLS